MQLGEALSVEAADRGLRNKGEVLLRLDVATALSVPTAKIGGKIGGLGWEMGIENTLKQQRKNLQAHRQQSNAP
jgi:hypothetical protein